MGDPRFQDKVVLHQNGATIKGHMDRTRWDPALGLDSLHLQPLGSDEVISIPLGDAKALFFVKTFEGTGHDSLRFHDHLIPMNSLWIRATFFDGEVVEGIIENTSPFVLGSHFFLYPTDPHDNNLRILIFKERLRDFQVLGLRTAILPRPA